MGVLVSRRQLAFEVFQKDDRAAAKGTWGGRREGAGRKKRPASPGCRPGVPHRARPKHARRDPVHVTLRGMHEVAFFRTEIVFGAMRRAMAAKKRVDFRVAHFSVQRDHVHLLVEATDRESLRSGMQSLTSRLARAVNRGLGRRGRVWHERYHRRDLHSPTEVRHALVYVLQNGAKHGVVGARASRAARAHDALRNLDPCSSAAYFDGWTPRAGPRLLELARAEPALRTITCPVQEPRTWLLREGWRLGGGALDPAEVPLAPRPLRGR